MRECIKLHKVNTPTVQLSCIIMKANFNGFFLFFIIVLTENITVALEASYKIA